MTTLNNNLKKKIPVIYSKTLRERDYGKAVGVNVDDIIEMKDGQKYWKGTDKSLKDRNYKGAYGETLHEIYTRASCLLDNIIEHYFFDEEIEDFILHKKDPSKKTHSILLMSHLTFIAEFINCLQKEFSGIPSF
jgi:broad specificity phosphatase PhoE